jgi:hypothetical protein
MKEPTDIRIAEILSHEKIVINKGLIDNIDSSMEFLIYADGQDIKDPLTGKSLGKLENPKGIFKVFHIQENMTTLISKINKPNSLFNVNSFLELNPEIESLKSIRMTDKIKIINLKQSK